MAGLVRWTGFIWIKLATGVWTEVEYTDESPVERRAGLLCSPYLFGGRIRGFETWRVPFTPDHEMLRQESFVGHFIR